MTEAGRIVTHKCIRPSIFDLHQVNQPLAQELP